MIAGLEPRVSFDIDDVVDGFRDLSRRARNLRRVWQDIKPDFEADQKDHFRRRMGPDGRWPPRAQSTRDRNRYRRGRRKRPPTSANGALLGQMRKSWKTEITRNAIRGISKVPFSGAHQTGATVGHGAKLPARVHHWASGNLMDTIANRIVRHVAEALER